MSHLRVWIVIREHECVVRERGCSFESMDVSLESVDMSRTQFSEHSLKGCHS